VSTSAEQPAAGAPLTLYLVKRLELAVRALLDDALRPLGLTTLQYTALTVLEASGALSSAQLARRSFLRPQTMHEMVLALEKRGLIERTPKPDNKRVLLASLTVAGRALLAGCAPAVGEVEQELLADLSPGQRTTFREGLQHGVMALGTLAEARRTNQDS
jgi:DNA-binding MarR family transcriptional regulator